MKNIEPIATEHCAACHGSGRNPVVLYDENFKATSVWSSTLCVICLGKGKL